MSFTHVAFETDGVTISEWGECLPNCPQEVTNIVCLDEPEFPAYAANGEIYVNYSSNFVQGSGDITFELDYVEFACPEGYHFEDTTNVTHYALCHNWDWTYNFDFDKKCYRMTTQSNNCTVKVQF